MTARLSKAERHAYDIYKQVYQSDRFESMQRRKTYELRKALLDSALTKIAMEEIKKESKTETVKKLRQAALDKAKEQPFDLHADLLTLTRRRRND